MRTDDRTLVLNKSFVRGTLRAPGPRARVVHNTTTFRCCAFCMLHWLFAAIAVRAISALRIVFSHSAKAVLTPGVASSLEDEHCVRSPTSS